MRKKLVEIALKEEGVQETPHHNNIGPRIQEYQTATWLTPGSWPWCSALTCWVLREACKNLDFKKAVTDKYPSWHLCKDASAFGWVKWAQKVGIPTYSETDLAKAGDFVVFDFSHIGMVIEDQDSPTNLIRTIEGNTNGRGDRDSPTGDGVWKKKRSPTLVQRYIRLFP